MLNVTCPTCLTLLNVPEGWSPSQPIICVNCDRRIWLGVSNQAGDHPSETFWDQLPIDAVLEEIAPLQPEVPVDISDATNPLPPLEPPRETVSTPTPLAATRPSWIHGARFVFALGAVGLIAGLILATLFTPSYFGRIEPRELIATWRRPPIPIQTAGPPATVPLLPPPTSDTSIEATSPPEAVEAPTSPKAEDSPLVAEAPTEAPEATNSTAASWAFENWIQDFDQGAILAREQNKDVLLLFDSSDWSDFSRALAREVFARSEFWDRIAAKFVTVHVDFPQYPRAQRRVQDAKRNEALQARFFKYPAYPRLVLADAEGRPYAVEMGYTPGDAERFVSKLEAHREKRLDRDVILADAEKADGEEKLRAAEAALKFLAIEIESPVPRDNGTYVLDLAEFYSPLLKKWRALADEHDPKNASGYRERFFWADWVRRERKAMADESSAEEPLKSLADEFDSWSEHFPFKDPDLAADLYDRQAKLAQRLSDQKRAERAIQAALALNPSSSWRRSLVGTLPPKPPSGRGTGFIVAPGYVVTNHHVVNGPGAVRVRITGLEPIATVVVAEDEAADLALLKVELPPNLKLKALHVAPNAPVGRGSEVMALGYTINEAMLQFTRGSVSSRVEDPATKTLFIVLDQRVNPGNSGGPLCDANGNVVGVVTAKTISTLLQDSYGIALGAEVLNRFLVRHLADKGYRPSPPYYRKYEWEVIDRWVSPSVVLVLKGSE